MSIWCGFPPTLPVLLHCVSQLQFQHVIVTVTAQSVIVSALQSVSRLGIQLQSLLSANLMCSGKESLYFV